MILHNDRRLNQDPPDPQKPSTPCPSGAAGEKLELLGDARHVVIAALLRDDLGPRVAARLRRRHFDDPVLRDAAAFAVGSISTFGVAEWGTLRRLLLRTHRRERVELELQVIDRFVQFITMADADAALTQLGATSNRAEA